MPNLFENLPSDVPEEVFDIICMTSNVRIERIVSDGHVTPEGEWYDQDQMEWVIVLKGSGEIEYEDGRREALREGDHLLINKHVKHRVAKTERPTIWLAVFFD